MPKTLLTTRCLQAHHFPAQRRPYDLPYTCSTNITRRSDCRRPFKSSRRPWYRGCTLRTHGSRSERNTAINSRPRLKQSQRPRPCLPQVCSTRCHRLCDCIQRLTPYTEHRDIHWRTIAPEVQRTVVPFAIASQWLGRSWRTSLCHYAPLLPLECWCCDCFVYCLL